MAHRYCLVPRCPNYALPGKSKCDKHSREYERNRSRRRREKTDGVYGKKRWAILRRKKLAGLCECRGCPECKQMPGSTRCSAIAQECDHIVPLAEGGAPFDPQNTQGLCTPCHRQKTAGENRHGDREGDAL